MNNLIWLIRASRWVRNPPSRRMVYLVCGIIAAALILAGLEYAGLWPEALTLDHGRGGRAPLLR